MLRISVDQQYKDQVLKEMDFKEHVKSKNIKILLHKQKLCQLKHESQYNLSYSNQQYLLISKCDRINNIKKKEIKPVLFNQKTVINKKVMNDYIEVVNNRGEIVDNLYNEYQQLVEAKSDQQNYFHKYYNDSTFKQLQNTIQSLSPEFRFGTNSLMKSAQVIKDRIDMAGKEVFVREKKNKEQDEKQKQLNNELHQEQDWTEQMFNEMQEKKEKFKQILSKKCKSQKERIAKISGYLIDAQDPETAKEDTEYLLEMQKFCSARMKKMMYKSEMKKNQNSKSVQRIPEEKDQNIFINSNQQSIKNISQQMIPEETEKPKLNLNIQIKNNKIRNSLTSRIKEREPYQLIQSNINKQIHTHQKSLSTNIQSLFKERVIPQTAEGMKTNNTAQKTDSSNQLGSHQKHIFSINLENSNIHMYENKAQTSREFKTIQFQNINEKDLKDVGQVQSAQSGRGLDFDSKNQKDIEEFQRYQDNIYLLKNQNIENINKYQEKVLGQGKNFKPKYTREQLKQFEHKDKDQYKDVKHSVQTDYYSQRKKKIDEQKIHELYGDKVNSIFKQIFKKQNFKKLFQKLSSQNKKLDHNYKIIETCYDYYLGDKNTVFWDMPQKKFEKLKSQGLIGFSDAAVREAKQSKILTRKSLLQQYKTQNNDVKQSNLTQQIV